MAKEIAVESRDSRDSYDELWERVSRDDYMRYAVQECYHVIKLILIEILDDEGRMWLVIMKISVASNLNICFVINVMKEHVNQEVYTVISYSGSKGYMTILVQVSGGKVFRSTLISVSCRL
jgi:hypothetical protein